LQSGCRRKRTRTDPSLPEGLEANPAGRSNCRSGRALRVQRYSFRRHRAGRSRSVGYLPLSAGMAHARRVEARAIAHRTFQSPSLDALAMTEMGSLQISRLISTCCATSRAHHSHRHGPHRGRLDDQTVHLSRRRSTATRRAAPAGRRQDLARPPTPTACQSVAKRIGGSRLGRYRDYRLYHRINSSPLWAKRAASGASIAALSPAALPARARSAIPTKMTAKRNSENVT